MTQQPKVSVLISFYNLAPFVDQTMESVRIPIFFGFASWVMPRAVQRAVKV